MAKRQWRGIVYDTKNGHQHIIHVVEIEMDDGDVGAVRQRLLRLTKKIRSENATRTLVVERLQTRAEELGMTEEDINAVRILFRPDKVVEIWGRVESGQASLDDLGIIENLAMSGSQVLNWLKRIEHTTLAGLVYGGLMDKAINEIRKRNPEAA